MKSKSLQKGDNRIYYVFAGRYPSEKAHALYVAQVAQSFAEEGFTVEVVVPRRKPLDQGRPILYDQKYRFAVRYLFTVDLYDTVVPLKIAFFLNNFFFTLACLFYFLRKKGLFFSNEILPALLLSLAGKKVIYEMHDYPDGFKILFKILFKKCAWIITQNQYKKDKVSQEYSLPSQKIIVEPNGVDGVFFELEPVQEKAASKLLLPLDKFIVMYTGSLFDWKGADTLAEAARLLAPDFLVVFIGGNQRDTQKFQSKYGNLKNVAIKGYRPHSEIPLWLKAANCLVLPNTAKKEISQFYTSPMKLFEYMASGRPILVSDIPSVRSIISENEATFFRPDDVNALSNALVTLREEYDTHLAKVEFARKHALNYTWKLRAQRILQQIS